MALIPVVTKVSVTGSQPKLWSVVVNLTINSTGVWGSKVVLDKDFSIKYRTGEDLDAKQQEVLELAQSAVGKYIEEQNLLEHVKMDSLIAFVNENITTA